MGRAERSGPSDTGDLSLHGGAGPPRGVAGQAPGDAGAAAAEAATSAGNGLLTETPRVSCVSSLQWKIVISLNCLTLESSVILNIFSC